MNNILFVICMAITLVGTMETTYQICKLIVLDASARGLKYPRLWGLLAINGNNSSGLLFYLLRRRKYPLKNIDEHQRTLINKRKKSAGIGLLFVVIGIIGLILCCSL